MPTPQRVRSSPTPREGAAIETMLAAATQKLTTMRGLTARSITVHLGMPDIRDLTGRSSPGSG